MGNYYCGLCEATHPDVKEHTNCPSCGRNYCKEAIRAARSAGRFTCPYCDSPFILPSQTGSQQVASQLDNVTLTLAASPPKVKPGATIWQYLQVLIEAGEVVKLAEKRAPLNLCLVIDRSGSMGGDAMKYARDAAIAVVNNLGKKDIVSIVAYDHFIETVIQPVPAKKNRTTIINAIQQLEARGATDLHGGLVQGIAEVQKRVHPNFTNRVILLSDGMANRGQYTNSTAIRNDLRKQMANLPLSISTFGMGPQFNEVLLEDLAEEFRGNYYYIEEANFIPRLIARELTGLLTLLWKNVYLTFQTGKPLTIKEILGYTVKGHTSYIGEVRSLDELYVIAKYFIPNELALGQKIIVTLQYDDVVQQLKNQKQIFQFPVEFASDDTELEENIAIVVNLELYAMGNDIESARQQMEAGEYTTAAEIIEKRITIMKDLIDKQPHDERLTVKQKFLETMLQRAKNQAYDAKFGKMSSYYSYSAKKSRYRLKTQEKYGTKDTE